MMIRSSLARRITLRFVVFTLVLSMVYSAAAVVIAYIAEDQVIDNLLEREAQALAQGYTAAGQEPVPSSPMMQLFLAREAPPSFTARMGEASAGEFSLEGRHYHFRRILFAQGDAGVLVADVTDLLSFSGIRSDLVLMLVLALVVSVALAVLFAYRLAAYATGPIRKLTESVLCLSRQYHLEELAGHNRTELDDLVAVVEYSLTKLNALLEREQAFNKDVSHELRTPLTIIRNQLALADSRNIQSGDVVQMQEAVADIERIVQSLLALARAETSEREVFELTAVIEESIIVREPRADGITVTLPERIIVKGNRQLAALVMGNLIDNALNHSADGSLDIFYEDGHLRFANPSTSLPTGDPLQPGVAQHGSQGIGQGLYLVQRILQAMHWQCRLEVADSRFCVSVEPTLCGDTR